MDDAEVEWRAHTTQICRIKANTKKHRQEVLSTTNVIQDAIEKNNMIFTGKWEMTHNHINRRLEELHLLKNRVIDLEALIGLQQTTLQSCQSTIAGLEETILNLAVLVTVLEKLVCHCQDHLLLLAPHYTPGEEEEMVKEMEEGTVIGHYFCSYFSSIFDPTSLHIPYPTFLHHVYLCYVYPFMSFTLTNGQQEHKSIGTTGHRTTHLLDY